MNSYQRKLNLMFLNLFFVFGCVMLKTSNLLYSMKNQNKQPKLSETSHISSVSSRNCLDSIYMDSAGAALGGSFTSKTKF